MKNLRSALAFGALKTLSGESESKLYENIVNIPHYHTKGLQLLDKEEEEEVVSENFDKFQEMYHPIWKSTFQDSFDLKDGKLLIDHSPATRKFLMSHLNDNVFQNIDRISLKSYDQDEKFHKDTFDLARKNKIADEILIEHKDDIENQNKEFYKAVDKIQIAHRNTKIFLFIMSWQFFVAYFIFKKTMQGLFLYVMYKKGKNIVIPTASTASDVQEPLVDIN